jgi:hypothetical protein
MSGLVRIQREKLSEGLSEFSRPNSNKVYLNRFDLISGLHDIRRWTFLYFTRKHASSQVEVYHTFGVKYRQERMLELALNPLFHSKHLRLF